MCTLYVCSFCCLCLLPIYIYIYDIYIHNPIYMYILYVYIRTYMYILCILFIQDTSDIQIYKYTTIHTMGSSYICILYMIRVLHQLVHRLLAVGHEEEERLRREYIYIYIRYISLSISPYIIVCIYIYTHTTINYIHTMTT